MTEQKTNPQEAWQTLSESQQKTCITFAVSHWRTGVDKDYLDAMGVTDRDTEELQKRGVLDVRPGWQFFQEFVDEHKDEVTKMRQKFHDNPLERMTEDERNLLNEFGRYESVANRRNETLRYRLADEKLHNFINDSFAE